MAATDNLTTRLEVFIDCDPGSDVYEYRVVLDKQTEGCGRMDSRSIAEGHAYSVLARLKRQHPELAGARPIWSYREHGGITYRKEQVAISIDADDRLHITLRESPTYTSLVDLADLLEQQPLLRVLSGRTPLTAPPAPLAALGPAPAGNIKPPAKARPAARAAASNATPDTSPAPAPAGARPSSSGAAPEPGAAPAKARRGRR